MKFIWLGHSAIYIEISNLKIIIDPWITNPLSPFKSTEDFVKEIKEIDYIFVTHDHGDHVGEAKELLEVYKNAKFVGIYELARKIGNHNTIGANIGGPIKLNNEVIAILTPAFHSSNIGNPTGIVLISKEGNIYHAGDTGVFNDMGLIKELYNIDVALLPIGGHFTMGIKEAVKATQLIKPKYVIPIHYNTFDNIKADPNVFAEEVKKLGLLINVIILKPGVSYNLRL
ncbi:MAG: metal-dependent hydrolase [Candidatus Methanomethylicaceae archaeon]|nr:metal-dependent hydrolase [Candidatus Verstraetearchaeota archaeon]